MKRKNNIKKKATARKSVSPIEKSLMRAATQFEKMVSGDKLVARITRVNKAALT